MNTFMIAGTKSGVGKTTISMGLMAALSKKNTVQPYKVGPDYIDPAFHSYITKRKCRNLDSFMLQDEMIHYLFHKNLQGADMAIVEGVMGLFDGAEVGSDVGTSASIAKMLRLPVILVVDGSKVATSLAATVKGFAEFDENLQIAGVIINNVGSKTHYELLKKGIEYHTDVIPCGYLLKNSALSLPERHLGLVPAGELDELDAMFDQLAESIERTIDLDLIMRLSERENGFDEKAQLKEGTIDVKQGNQWIIQQFATIKETAKPVRIGLAMDKAFNFYYQDALDLMEDYCKVTWVPFSPLSDKGLPQDIDGIYLGGGFPEIFASELASNTSFIEDLLNRLNNGMPYLAECGGLMYLCDSLIDLEEVSHKMTGWLKGSTHMTKRLQRFGYATITLKEDSVYGTKGSQIRIHEFHRSSADVEADTLFHTEKVRYGEVVKEWECGYVKGNGVAGYAHCHFGSNMDFGQAFARECLEYKKQRNVWDKDDE